MPPLTWRAAARQLNGQSAHHASRIRTPLAAESRTYSRPRTSTPPLSSRRVFGPQSRVSTFTSWPRRSFSRHASKSTGRWAPKSLLPENTTILHSGFPTKTVLFLVALGTAAYFFVDVKYVDWTDRVLDSFNGDPGAVPIHFYKDREEVDHWLQYHVPDPSAPLRDPEVLRQVSERFAEVAFGWEIGMEDAREDGIPVTHGCRFRSNEPCEDYYALGTSPGPGSKPWNYWSIYDGHAGRHTAYTLQWTMHPTLSLALSNLSPSATTASIHQTIKNVFLRIDSDIMTRAKNAANWYPAANAAAISALTPAFSGSCALLAAFDPDTSKLHVACTGDSRAVLGRWDAVESKYVALPLSEDQTGFNADEIARLTASHPDEPTMLDSSTGRLLGLAVTRAFGDHRWKWDNDFVAQCQTKFWGSAPRPKSATPPYLTAEPEVTETRIVRADPTDRYAKSDFMIMASDGLWDHITSAHAVTCVSEWLSARARGNGKVSQDPLLQPPVFTQNFSLDAGVEVGTEITWQASPEFFAIEDDNAAVCLARNAMGGTRRGLFLGLLSVPGPLCRGAVDDTTVMVVFFDRVGELQGGDKAVGVKKEKKWWWPL